MFGVRLIQLLCLFWLTWPSPPISAGEVREIRIDGQVRSGLAGTRLTRVDVEFTADGRLLILTRPESVQASTANDRQSPGALAGAAEPVSREEMIVEPPAQSPSLSSAAPSGEILPGSFAPASSAEKLEGRYWIAIFAQAEGLPWQIDVALNGQSVGSFSSTSPVLEEVTSFLRRGENKATVGFQLPHSSSPRSDLLPSTGTAKLVLAPGRVEPVENEIALGVPILQLEKRGSDPGGTVDQQFMLPPPMLP